MKLLEIWERLGRQSLTITKYQEAKVFIDDKEYIITKVKYDSGKLMGFEAMRKNCSIYKNNIDFPPPHTCDICTSLEDEEEYKMWEAK